MYVCFVLTAKQLSHWTTDLETHTFCRVIFLERVKREEMRGGGVSRRWKIVAACCLCQKRQASSNARIPAHTTMIPAGFSCKDSVFFLFVVFSSVSMWAWQVSDRLSTGSQFSFAFPFAHRGKKIVGMRRKNGAAKKIQPNKWLIDFWGPIRLMSLTNTRTRALSLMFELFYYEHNDVTKRVWTTGELFLFTTDNMVTVALWITKKHD